MKLLSKNEITQKKGTERREEIEQGVTLARKVDALRELAAKEESNLSKFRTETLKRIKEEIGTLSSQKQSLLDEIYELTEQRKILLVPLDAEWEKVRTEASRLAIYKDEVLKHEDQVFSETLRLEKLEESLRDEEDRIQESKENSKKMESEALLMYRSAEKALSDAQSTKTEFETQCGIRHRDLLSKEANLAVRERQVTIKMEYNDKREIELNNRERAINDKYETLLRTQKHVG